MSKIYKYKIIRIFDSSEMYLNTYHSFDSDNYDFRYIGDPVRNDYRYLPYNKEHDEFIMPYHDFEIFFIKRAKAED